MATPLAEKIKSYFPTKELTADGQALTAFVATTGLTTSKLVDSVNTQADGFYDGAIGWFLETTTTTSLRGQFFHVKTHSSNEFNLAKPLPALPVIGDTFRIVMGGKYRSTQEMFGLLWAGKLPELVAPTTITGLTVKKVSPLIGAVTLYLKYTQTVKELSISIDNVNFGVIEAFTVNRTGVALYLPASDAFIIVDAVAASLPASTVTNSYAITIPANTLTPDFEGYETEVVTKGKSRFRLEVFKNESADTMVTPTAYINNPTNTSTTKSSGTVAPSTDAIMVIASATNLPAASFWIKNVTLNDIRYCKFRSGTSLYLPPVNWGTFGFNTGVLAFVEGDTISDFTTGATAIVDQLVIASGSFGAGTAVGTVTFKEIAGGTFTSGNLLKVGGITVATLNVSAVLGFRGKTAQTWANSDVLEIYPDIDIAFEIPTANLFSNPTVETKLPSGSLSFSAPTSFATGITTTSLLTTAIVGIWHREVILDQHKARANVTNDDVIVAWS